MANRHRWIFPILLLGPCLSLPGTLQAQVFVVGERSATADIATDFTPTRLPLPDSRMDERGRRELVRDLEAEQGFAHLALPIGPGLMLQANGQLRPSAADYRKMIYEKGQAAAAGDRVVITSVTVKPDRIVLDLNGGPYVKHRFLRHIQINDTQMVGDPFAVATGSRITLLFEGGVPEISAPEVKALLQPVIDFRVKTSEEAYADTLPTPIKDAVASHDVLVGMNHRMVLAAAGAPETKVREQDSGGEYEEWIYGHIPQTVRFVRFHGDRVTQVKVAELGKPIVVRTEDEMGGYNPPPPTREIAMGDRSPDSTGDLSAPPTLRKPGEAAPANAPGKVLYPDKGKDDAKANAAPIPATPSMPAQTMPDQTMPDPTLADPTMPAGRQRPHQQ